MDPPDLATSMDVARILERLEKLEKKVDLLAEKVNASSSTSSAAAAGLPEIQKDLADVSGETSALAQRTSVGDANLRSNELAR